MGGFYFVCAATPANGSLRGRRDLFCIVYVWVCVDGDRCEIDEKCDRYCECDIVSVWIDRHSKEYIPIKHLVAAMLY